MERTIYSKYSNERAERFRIRTDIVTDEAGEKKVYKYACTIQAGDHIRRQEERGIRGQPHHLLPLYDRGCAGGMQKRVAVCTGGQSAASHGTGGGSRRLGERGTDGRGVCRPCVRQRRRDPL